MTQERDTLRRLDATNRRLLKTIEQEYICSTEELSKVLKRNKDKLAKVLLWYKKKDATARSKIVPGVVQDSGRSYKVDEPQKQFILKLSDALDLNELQTLDLFQSFLRGRRSLNYSDKTLDEVIEHFYAEKLALVNCVCVLLRIYNEAANLRFPFNEFVGELITSWNQDPNGLLTMYKSTKNNFDPKEKSKEVASKIANYNIHIQYSLLAAIFLIYYSGSYPANELPNIFSALKDFGSKQICEPYLSIDVVEKLDDIGHLCTLVLIEVLHLEKSIREEVPSELLEDGLENEILAIVRELEDHHAGPVVLSWLCVQVNINKTKDRTDTDVLTDLFYKAQKLNAIPGLLELVTRFIPNSQDPQGYCAIVRDLLDAIGETFKQLPEFSALVEIFYHIHKQANALSAGFWQNLHRTGDLGKILTRSLEEFPSEFIPFMKILSSLVADQESANKVFHLLEVSENYQYYLLRESNAKISYASPNNVITIQPVTIGPLTLPVGTRGIIVSQEKDYNVVRWRVRYSPWVFIFRKIDALQTSHSDMPITESIYYDIQAALTLLHELIDKWPDFLEYLTTHLKANAHIVSNFQQDFFSVDGIVRQLFSIFTVCAHTHSPKDDLLEACVKCIHSIAQSNPYIVWMEFQRSRLLPDHNFGVSTYEGPIHHVLQNVECVQGRYPVTLAFLDLLTTLLKFVQRWHHHPPEFVSKKNDRMDEGSMMIDNQNFDISYDFLPCLSYVRTDLWANFDTWRYTSVKQRWQISTKILKLFYEVLTDTPTTISSKTPKDSLKVSLFLSILHDSSFHANLLKIIGIGPISVERARSRNEQESGTIKDMVEITFSVVSHVLALKEYMDDNGVPSDIPISMSSLESALLSRKVGPGSGQDLVEVIVSYITHDLSTELPLLALRLFTSLCATTSGNQYVSLVGYVENQKDDMRQLFMDKMRERTESSERMKIAIFDFLRVALHPQPALTAIFLPQGTFSMKKPESTTPSNLTSTQSTETEEYYSCMDAAVDILSQVDQMLDDSPQLLVSVLELMSELWKNAPGHFAIIKALRDRQNFSLWKQIAAVLYADPYNDTYKRIDIDIDENSDEYTYKHSNRILCQALAFDILCSEIFYVSPDGVDTFMNDISGLFKSETQFSWVERFTMMKNLSFDNTLHQKVVDNAHALSIFLPDLETIPENARYGMNYKYDTTLLRNKLGLENTKKKKNFQKKLYSFVQSVEKYNEQLSVAEAQLAASRSWHKFTTIYLAKIHRRTFFDDEKSLKKFIEELTSSIAKNNDDSLPLYTLNIQVTSLLLTILRHWATLNTKKTYSSDSLKNLRDALARVLNASPEDDQCCRNILASLLVLLKSYSSGNTFWSHSIAKEAVPLLPLLFSSLVFPTLKPIALGILELLNQRISETAILAQSYKLRYLGVIADHVHKISQDLFERKHVEETISVLHFMLSMSSTTSLAELLITNGLVLAFCNENFAQYSSSELFPYNEKGEYNPWHQAWSLMLSVVVQMSWSLGCKEGIIDQVIDFILVHKGRIMAMLDFDQHKSRKTPSQQIPTQQPLFQIQSQAQQNFPDTKIPAGTVSTPFIPSSSAYQSTPSRSYGFPQPTTTTNISTPQIRAPQPPQTPQSVLQTPTRTPFKMMYAETPSSTTVMSTPAQKTSMDMAVTPAQSDKTSVATATKSSMFKLFPTSTPAPTNCPSIRTLIEAELITAILCPLATFNGLWVSQEKKLSDNLLSSLLKFIVQTKELLLRPTSTLTTVHPISVEERSWNKDAPLTFELKVDIILHRILRNILAYLRYFTHSPFSSDGIFRTFPPPLFEPWLDTREVGANPPIGIVLECLNNTFVTLKKLLRPAPSALVTPVKETEHSRQELSEESTEAVNTILFIMENGIYIILSHAQIFSFIPEYQFYVQELVIELDSFMGRFEREIQLTARISAILEYFGLVKVELKALQTKLQQQQHQRF